MRRILPLLFITIIVSTVLTGVGCKEAVDTTMTEADCIKYLNARVSDIEFGRSKTEFTTDSGLYPAVGAEAKSKSCTRQVAVVLLDSSNEIILEKAYNLPPGGEGGETGYGDYNQERTLTPGDYKFEFYYGDTLFKIIDIEIK